MVRSSGELALLWGPILVLGVVVLGAGLGAGCSQAPAPETAVPEAPAEVASEAPPATAEAPPATAEAAPVPDPAPAPPAEEPAPAAAEEPDPTVIVIERRDREREAKPRTLYEASVAAREQRDRSRPSTVAITDENLHEFQGQGLTFAEAAEGEEAETEGAEEEAAAEAAADAGSAAAGPVRDETYWRTRVRDLRLALRQAVDELDEIEERAASLRRSFYAEDDPYVRDAEIKPAWDRALDRISDTRRALTRMRDELAATLEEGRRAGALPGWLREGIELEPLPEELPPPGEGTGTHEPGEPSVIEIGEPPP